MRGLAAADAVGRKRPTVVCRGSSAVLALAEALAGVRVERGAARDLAQHIQRANPAVEASAFANVVVAAALLRDEKGLHGRAGRVW